MSQIQRLPFVLFPSASRPQSRSVHELLKGAYASLAQRGWGRGWQGPCIMAHIGYTLGLDEHSIGHTRLIAEANACAKALGFENSRDAERWNDQLPKGEAGRKMVEQRLLRAINETKPFVVPEPETNGIKISDQRIPDQRPARELIRELISA